MDWEGLLKDLFDTLSAVKITLFPMQVNIQTLQDKEIQIIFYASQNLELNIGSYSGCSQMHCLKYCGNNIIHMSETSDCTTFTVVKAFIE